MVAKGGVSAMKLPRFLWFVPVLVAFLVLPVQGQGVTRAVPDPIGSVIAGVQVTVVQKMVPFKGKGTMWFVAEGDDSPCLDVPGWEDTSFLESEGTSTHFGRSTTTFTNCMGEGEFLQRPLLAQFATMRAANGDLIFAQGFADDPDMPFSFIVDYSDWSWETQNMRIVGGTGRFENATGWWSCSGDNIAAPRSNWTCEGEISTVGSGKRAR
jgi:hypothetical protein